MTGMTDPTVCPLGVPIPDCLNRPAQRPLEPVSCLPKLPLPGIGPIWTPLRLDPAHVSHLGDTHLARVVRESLVPPRGFAS